MHDLTLTGGTVLLASDGPQQTDLVLKGGLIDRIGAGSAGARLDASGLLVLPGIVDLHGDAFERQLQPRPGVDFPVDVALRDTETQLLANGITTAFHGVTLSWEPGLRSLTAWRALLDALAAGSWTCDMRVHLRWEAFNLDALNTAVDDIAAGRVHLLAFNDHTPAIVKKLQDPVHRCQVQRPRGDGARCVPRHDRPRRRARRCGACRIGPGCRRRSRRWLADGEPTDDDSVAVPRRLSVRAARGSANSRWPRRSAERRPRRGDFVAMGCPETWSAAAPTSAGHRLQRWPRPASVRC